MRRIVHIETLLLQKAEQSFCSTSYADAFEGQASGHMAILARYERSLENTLFRALKELKLLKGQSELEICGFPS